MKLEITRVKVYAASMRDKPGALAKKLTAIAEAGANLGFVIARRTPEKRSGGVVFITPLQGAAQHRAAKKAGFKATKRLHSIRVEGADKIGICAVLSQALADNGLNLRGASAAAIGRRFVCHLAFDKADDATLAARILRKL